jgi:Tfp pilus assembly protein FimT
MIELVISLFIIMMMVALFLANYSAGNNSNNLSLGAQQLVSDIRLAQNKALGATPYNGSQSAGGWGMHIDKNSPNYILFADVNTPANMKYDSSPIDEASLASGGQTFSLPSKIIVSNITANGSVPNPTSLDITFLPPDPSTRIYDGTGTSSDIATITLQNTVTSKTTTITVNVLGLIQAN